MHTIFKIDYINSDDKKTYIDVFSVDGNYSSYSKTFRVNAKYNGGDIYQFIHENDSFVTTVNYSLDNQLSMFIDSLTGLNSEKAWKGGMEK